MLAVFWFEMRRALRAPSTWVAFGVLVLMSLQSSMGGYWDDLLGTGKVARNSPYGAYFNSMYASFWATMIGSFLCGAPVLRDLGDRTARLTFATPISDRAYFWGKYLASLLTLLLVLSSLTVAFVLMAPVAVGLGIKPASQFMAIPWAHVFHAWLLFTVTGAFCFATFFHCLAARSGSMAPCYIASALSLLLFVFLASSAESGLFDGDNAVGNAMRALDPAGFVVLKSQIDFWSVAERNSSFLPLAGALLWNKILYLALPLAILALSAATFNLRGLLLKGKPRKRGLRRQRGGAPVTSTCDSASAAPKREARHEVAASARSLGSVAWLQTALSNGWREFVTITREAPFRLMAAFLVFYTYTHSVPWVSPEGRVLPVLSDQLPRVLTTALFALFVTAIYFAGEISARERTLRVDRLVGATPAPDWALLLTKAVAITLLCTLITALPVAGCFLQQATSGALGFTWKPLLQDALAGTWLGLLSFALLTLALHAIVRSKALGNTLALAAFVLSVILGESGQAEHFASRFGLSPMGVLSDFDTGSEFLRQRFEAAAMWLSLCGALLVVALWLWPRGTQSDMRSRLQVLAGRVTPISALACAAFLAAFAALQGHTRRQTALAGFQTRAEERGEAAAYEKKYASAEAVPQPKITRADLDFRLDPEARRLDTRATWTLENKTREAVRVLHLDLPLFCRLSRVAFDGQAAPLQSDDAALRHQVYRLPRALAPGQSITLAFEAQTQLAGYRGDSYVGPLVADGSVWGVQMLPKIGYDPSREVELRNVRREMGLPEHHGGHLLPASQWEREPNAAASHDADLVEWKAKATVVGGQQAIVGPGLQRGEGEFSGRGGLWDLRFAAAGYATLRQDAGGVAIEVLHHPRHGANARRVAEAAGWAIKYLSSQLGPYPHRMLRLAEVPRGILGAQGGHSHGGAEESASSGNLILISEEHGWLHDYRREPSSQAGEIDWITYLVAREVARGWWGQKAIPADVQGHGLLLDSMPIFCGLEALRERRGVLTAQRWASVLRDRYLKASALEDGVEPALLSGEEQPYLAERGALALFAAREAIGAPAMHAALRGWLSGLPARRDPPFAGALPVVEAVEKGAPQLAPYLRQAFAQPAVYDFKVRPQAYEGGQMRIEVEAQKFVADARDNRSPAEFSGLPVEVAAYQGGTEIGRQSFFVRQGVQVLEVPLASKPDRIEIDPRRLYIDRSTQDNSARVR